MTAQWKLKRQAARALKVLERNRDRSPAIAAFEGPLGTSARHFARAHSAVGAYAITWRVEMSEGRGAMAALRREIETWKPHVARERPGFDLSTVGDRPSVPEDLIEDGHALADQLDEVRDAEGRTVEWAADGAAGIRAKCDAAEKETDEAAAADAHYASLLSESREAAAVFEAELGRFRSSLRAVLGSSHPDVQKLRPGRARVSDPDDDPEDDAAEPAKR